MVNVTLEPNESVTVVTSSVVGFVLSGLLTLMGWNMGSEERLFFLKFSCLSLCFHFPNEANPIVFSSQYAHMVFPD